LGAFSPFSNVGQCVVKGGFAAANLDLQTCDNLDAAFTSNQVSLFKQFLFNLLLNYLFNLLLNYLSIYWFGCFAVQGHCWMTLSKLVEINYYKLF